jgi:hypothetical protein
MRYHGVSVFLWEAMVPVSPGRGRKTEIKDKVGPGSEQKRCPDILG